MTSPTFGGGGIPPQNPPFGGGGMINTALNQTVCILIVSFRAERGFDYDFKLSLFRFGVQLPLVLKGGGVQCLFWPLDLGGILLQNRSDFPQMTKKKDFNTIKWGGR